MKTEETVVEVKKGLEIASALLPRTERTSLLSAIVVDLENGNRKYVATRLTYLFYKKREALLQKKGITSTSIEIDNMKMKVSIRSTGLFPMSQVAELNRRTGSENFPEDPIKLDSIGVDLPDLIRVLKSDPISKLDRDALITSATVSLSLNCLDPKWVVLQDIVGFGFRTLHVNAMNGIVIFEKIDRQADG